MLWIVSEPLRAPSCQAIDSPLKGRGSYQHDVVVYLRYLILQLHSDNKTIALVMIQAAAVFPFKPPEACGEKHCPTRFRAGGRLRGVRLPEPPRRFSKETKKRKVGFGLSVHNQMWGLASRIRSCWNSEAYCLDFGGLGLKTRLSLGRWMSGFGLRKWKLSWEGLLTNRSRETFKKIEISFSYRPGPLTYNLTTPVRRGAGLTTSIASPARYCYLDDLQLRSPTRLLLASALTDFLKGTWHMQDALQSDQFVLNLTGSRAVPILRRGGVLANFAPNTLAHQSSPGKLTTPTALRCIKNK